MAAGLEAQEAQAGGVLGDGAGQGVATLAVDLTHPPYVPVVAARLDQGGEGHLVERGRAATGQRASRRPPPAQRRRHEHPAEADPGGQRLADRAQGDHPVGGESLQRPDGLAVVAELGVVVVLEGSSVDLGCPRDQRVAPLGRQHHAGRALVGRGDDDGSGAGVAGSASTSRPSLVDRHGTGIIPARRTGDRSCSRRPRILEADARDARAREGAQHHVESLAEAADVITTSSASATGRGRGGR